MSQTTNQKTSDHDDANIFCWKIWVKKPAMVLSGGDSQHLGDLIRRQSYFFAFKTDVKWTTNATEGAISLSKESWSQLFKSQKMDHGILATFTLSPRKCSSSNHWTIHLWVSEMANQPANVAILIGKMIIDRSKRGTPLAIKHAVLENGP